MSRPSDLASRLGVSNLTPTIESEIEDAPYYPVRDRILVLPQRQDERTSGGVYLPDTSRDKPWVSKIIRFGHLVKELLPNIENETLVLHSKYSGTTILYKNTQFMILAAKDVLAFEHE